MKKKLIFAAGAMIIAAAVSAAVCLNFGQTRHNDLFEQNLDALARGEGTYDGLEGMKNVTDHRQDTRLQVKYDPETGGEITYESTCHVWYTYCKNARKDKVCYPELNGLVESCN